MYPTVRWSLTVLCAVLLGYQLACCINVYDPAISVCCDGHLVTRGPNAGSTAACCGRNLLYDNATQLCCRDDASNVSSVVQANAGRLSAQMCCDGEAAIRIFPNSECCGRKVIDADRFMCCEGTVVRRVNTRGRQVLACCKNQGFDPVRQLCCDGKVHRKWGSTAECCGDQAFDVGQQGCCGGSVYTDPFGIEGCCGGHTVYDALSDICCGDKVVSDPLRVKGCCGDSGTGYVVANETCCNGVVRPKTKTAGFSSSATNSSIGTSLSPCCNNATYLRGSALCCRNTLVQLPKHASKDTNDYACCGHKGFFNVHEELCCAGKVMKRRSERTRCCGEFGYEEDGSETCCGESVLTAANTVAREGTRQCCRGHVIMVPPGRELCC